jgi:hypothetical protein
MEGDSRLSRLARLKAEKIYQEMVEEGLTRDDLPRKLREIAEREEATVARLAAKYELDPIDVRLLLQLAVDDEWIAEQGIIAFLMTGSMMHSIAVMTLYNGEEYVYGQS